MSETSRERAPAEHRFDFLDALRGVAILAVVLSAGTVFVAGRTFASVFPLTGLDWLLNVLLLQGPFGSPDVQLVYWSLSIEVQFYLVMAMCLVCLARAEFVLVAVSAVSLGAQLFPVLPVSGTVLAYWHQFACGIATFYLITRQHRFRAAPWLLLGLGVCSAMVDFARSSQAVAANGHVHGGIKMLVCLAAAALLVVIHRFDAKLTRTRVVRVLMTIGAISYTLYLTHVLVGTRVFNLGNRLTGLEQWWWMFYVLVALASSFIAGAVFFHYSEKPWLNMGARTVPIGTTQTVSEPVA